MKGYRLILSLIVLFVVLFPLAVWYLLWRHEAHGAVVPDIGIVTSSFGDIVSPIFAALAFAGLIITALMQREELSLQRDELKDTRKELKRQADAQEASEKALAAQVDVAQLSASLNATRAIFEYYGALVEEWRKWQDWPDATLRSIVLSHKNKVPDARFDRTIMDGPIDPEPAISIQSRFLSFYQSLVEAQERAALEMHEIRNELRSKAQDASLTVTETGLAQKDR